MFLTDDRFGNSAGHTHEVNIYDSGFDSLSLALRSNHLAANIFNNHIIVIFNAPSCCNIGILIVIITTDKTNHAINMWLGPAKDHSRRVDFKVNGNHVTFTFPGRGQRISWTAPGSSHRSDQFNHAASTEDSGGGVQGAQRVRRLADAKGESNTA